MGLLNKAKYSPFFGSFRNLKLLCVLLDILLKKPGALTICMENSEIPWRIQCIEANGREHYLGTAG